MIALVETLNSRDWGRWTRHEIRGLLRSQVAEWEESWDDKDPRNGRTGLSHLGRENDWCECCETFLFGLHRDADGSLEERLASVTLFHAAESLEELISTTKELLMLIVPADRERVFSDSTWRIGEAETSLFEFFDCTVDLTDREKEPGRVASRTEVAQVQLSKEGTYWTLYVNYYQGLCSARLAEMP